MSDRLTLICGSCLLRYDVLDTSPDESYRCRKCDGVLRPADPPVRPADDVSPASRLVIPPQLPAEVIEAARDQKNHFGRYILLNQLGVGGMASVFHAYDPNLRRSVALKVLSTTEPIAMERFQREAHIVARLKHPHIVAIYETGRHERTPYIAMEFIEGSTFSHRVGRPPRETALLLRDVAETMHVAHQHGIIHRDLKPENILLENSPTGDLPRAYVTDFGLARETRRGHSLTSEGFTVGTPAYMPPEQATGRRNLDTRADVYALGAILYQALTGRAPYSGESDLETAMNVVQQDLVPPRRINPNVPRGLESICLRALEKDRDKRYATAHEMAEDLQRWLDGVTVLAPAPPLASRLGRRLRRHTALLATATLVVSLLGLGIALFFAFRARHSETAASEHTGEDDDKVARRLLDQARASSSAEEAIALATRALDANPDCADAYLVRGLAHQRNADHSAARFDLARAAQTPACSTDALNAQATSALALDRPAEAAECLNALLVRGIDSPPIRLRLGTAYVLHEEGFRALEAITGLTDHEATAVRAIALAQTGQLDDAAVEATHALPARAPAVFVHARRADHALSTNDSLQLAEALIALGRLGDIEEGHLLSGLASRARRVLEDKLVTAESANLRLRDLIVDHMDHIALQYILLAKLDDAESTLTVALSRHPRAAKTLAYRGLLAYVRQDFQRAIEDAESALAIDSSCLEARGVRGWGRLGSVRVSLESVTLPPPRDGIDPLWLRQCVDGFEDAQEFSSHITRWPELRKVTHQMVQVLQEFFVTTRRIDFNPTQLVAKRLAIRAHSRLENGDALCAHALCTHALAFNSTCAIALAERAHANVSLEKWKEAQADAQRAIELEPALKSSLQPLIDQAKTHEPPE